MNRYLIIEVNAEGNKTASLTEYADYDLACSVQELHEVAYPEYAYLIYTVDEWVKECEENA